MLEITKVSKLIQERAELAAQGETVEWDGQKVDPRYRFRRATLHKWLQPIITPEMYPQLRAIIPDSIAHERKAERDHERYRQGREAVYTGQGVRADNEKKRATARIMAACGMTNRRIATELGASHTTIRKWLEGVGGN